MEEALVDRVEAVYEAIVRRDKSSIVARIAIVKAVGHDKVEDFVLDGVARRGGDQGGDFRRYGTGLDQADVRGTVKGKRDRVAVVGHGEGDVWTIRHAAGAVVFVPAFVDGELALVDASREWCRSEMCKRRRRRHPAARSVDSQAPSHRGSRADSWKLPRHGDDALIDIVGDPMALVIVVELDVAVSSQGSRGMLAAIRLTVGAVIFVPGAVERRLVLPTAGRAH